MKDIRNYLQFYLGCETNKGLLIGLINCDKEKDDVQCICLLKDGGLVNGSIKNIKPLLRKLSSITEEELLEAVILRFGWLNRDVTEQKLKRVVKIKDTKAVSKYGTSIPYTVFDENDKHIMTATLSENQLTPDQFGYLFSKSFDLWNLIDSGLAIEKLSTLKEGTN